MNNQNDSSYVDCESLNVFEESSSQNIGKNK